MVSSAAATVAQYLAQLDPARRPLIEHARKLVKRHLPKGFVEAMGYGMITWQIPLARYPITYNKQPLAPVALAAQKNYNALYLMTAVADSPADETLRRAYTAAGKKLDMGKCCLRFKSADDLLVEAIAPLLAATTVDAYIALYEASRPAKK
jgi:Domain of unknown function (DU1801)